MIVLRVYLNYNSIFISDWRLHPTLVLEQRCSAMITILIKVFWWTRLQSVSTYLLPDLFLEVKKVTTYLIRQKNSDRACVKLYSSCWMKINCVFVAFLRGGLGFIGGLGTCGLEAFWSERPWLVVVIGLSWFGGLVWSHRLQSLQSQLLSGWSKLPGYLVWSSSSVWWKSCPSSYFGQCFLVCLYRPQ